MPNGRDTVQHDVDLDHFKTIDASVEISDVHVKVRDEEKTIPTADESKSQTGFAYKTSAGFDVLLRSFMPKSCADEQDIRHADRRMSLSGAV